MKRKISWVLVVGLCCLLPVCMVKMNLHQFTRTQSVSVTDFSEMHDAILANLIAPGHFMWQNAEGNFLGDWSGDAGAFAPSSLHNAGHDEIATKVLEYVSNLGTIGTYPVDFLVGFHSYLMGPVLKPEVGWCGLMDLGVAVGTADVMKEESALNAVAGHIAGMSQVSITSYRMANACLKKVMADNANKVMTQLNKAPAQGGYWDAVRGYYYDGNCNHQGSCMFSSFQNGMALSALAWHYGIYRESVTLSRINSIRTKSDAQLWDSSLGAYRDREGGFAGMDAGANLLWLRGWLWMYYMTSEQVYLDKSTSILNFIQNRLIMDDPQHPGFKVMAHDWYPPRGPSTNYCTGCNFLLLELIQNYNRFKAGDIHTGKIPIAPEPVSCNLVR